MTTAKIPGSWERRGTSVRLTVNLGSDFRGQRVRKRKTIPYISDKKADDALLTFFNECKDGAVSYSGKITLSALCDKYLEVCAKGNVKSSTYSGYVSIINSSIKPLIGHHAAEKVTGLHVQEWIAYLMNEGAPYRQGKNNHKEKDKEKKKGISAKSAANRLGLLNNIFESAIDWGMIKKNPCANVKLPKYKRPEADSYNEKEVALLIEKLLSLDDKRLMLKTAIMIDLFSGLRKGELIGLKWDKIDMGTGAYKIDSTRLYTPEEKNYTDTPKSDSGFRELVFPEFCIELLRKLQVQQEEKEVASPHDVWGPSQGFVFLNDYGRPIGTSTLYKQFVNFLEENGLRKIKLHTLRHTNASMIHSLNLTPSEISKWMGHSKISTTTDIYTHLFNNDSKKNIADKLQKSYVPIVSPNAKTNA